MANHNYHNTAEHSSSTSYQEGRTFSWRHTVRSRVNHCRRGLTNMISWPFARGQCNAIARM